MKKKILAAVLSFAMIFTKSPIVTYALEAPTPIDLKVALDYSIPAEIEIFTKTDSVITGDIGVSPIIPTTLTDYNMSMKERFSGGMGWN